MKKILLLFSALIVVVTSCNLIVDVDSTANVSLVSTKPVIVVEGEPIMSLVVGSEYVEAGCSVSVTADSTNYPYETISDVDENTEGFYTVKYEAVNGFGWKSIAYRAILIHDGTPYSDDISGTYEFGLIEELKKKSTISKYTDVNGYWYLSDCYGPLGIVLPIYLADLGDGENYGIVPVQNEIGTFTGTALRESSFMGTNITVFLKVELKDGSVYNQSYKWKQL